MWDESVSDETNEYNTAKKVAEDTDQVAYNLTGLLMIRKTATLHIKIRKLLLVKIQKEH